MNEKNASWDDLRLFLEVARGGGLSPAARISGRSAATLGRRMLALERSIGQDLFIRHERGYELTADGRHLFAELKRIEEQVTRLVVRPDALQRPLVKISAGTWTTLALLDRFDDIAGDPADIRLRFVASEDVLNIPQRQVAIGFRSSRPTNASLAGRKLSRVEFAPYATSSTCERWIKVLADTPSARWLDKTVVDDAICEVTSPRNSLDLALGGHGIALLPTFIGSRADGLTQIGAPIAELSHDQWIVTHQDDRQLPHVRRIIDRLYVVLAARPL